MRYVLFATAGHVDHGKTALIKALTGIDTDRLPEEKKKGMSIDLGFAYLDFPEIDIRVELIDIPGHERFIKNAIAGLVSVEAILLVVDPAEGIMKQTLEHVKVAKALGIKKGIAVIAKVDKYDEELISLAEEELREFLTKEDLNFSIVKVSAKTGYGLENLKENLKSLLKDYKNNKQELSLKILVDSAFNVKGYGTVIRGSCIEGYIEESDKVILEPQGIELNVRKIQNHGSFVKKAVAGERLAINVPEIDKKVVKRGDWILKPGTYVKTKNLIVELDVDIKISSLYLCFFGMKEVKGKFSKLNENIYLLKTENFIVTKREERFIVLNSSRGFIGGGIVLHPQPRILKKKFIKENLSYLIECFELYLLEEYGNKGIKGSTIKLLKGKDPDLKVLNKEALKIGDRFYSKRTIENINIKVKEYLDKKFSQKIYGVKKDEIRSKLSLKEEVLQEIIRNLNGYKIIEDFVVSVNKSDFTQSPEFRRLMELLSESIKEEREILNEGISKEILSLAIRKKFVHNLGNYLLISDKLLKEYIYKLRELGNSFSIQDAKKKLNLSRKYLIPFLEYLDLLGFTVRQGNFRTWRK
ncbi:MAG TPA: selenocysteine-specific translation elongation factor [Pyrodictium sp.]|nr:selenocysteine-specific translation elongation factor [Pyrodictium sp.]